jgi:hypothetical protein
MAQPLYLVKIWKMGSGAVIPLYKRVLEALHASVDDLLLIRVHPPYVTFRIIHAEQSMPVERFTDEELPPDWPKKVANV